MAVAHWRPRQGVYDILLLIKFQKVRPPEEAGAAAD
jgi:hypothetical protein